MRLDDVPWYLVALLLGYGAMVGVVLLGTVYLAVERFASNEHEWVRDDD